MAKYLFIASRDPFASNEVARYFETAKGLKKEGHAVSILLVQNGVLPARNSTKSKLLAQLMAAGVDVLADELSLRERGIPKARLADGVKVSSLDVVIDCLEQDAKVLFN